MAAALVTLCRALTLTSLASRPVLCGLLRPGQSMAAPQGSELLAANRPVFLNVVRDRDGASGALVGTVSVWGANLGNPDMGSANTAVFKGDGIATNYDSTIPYVAFLNYNWIPIIFRGDLKTNTGTVTSVIGTLALVGSGTLFTTECFVGGSIQFNGETHVISEITDATHLTLEDPALASVAGAAVKGSPFPVQLLTTDFTIANNGGNARLTLAAANQAPAGSRIELHFVTPQQLLADGAHPFERVQIKSKTAMWVLFGAGTSSITTATIEPAQ